MLTPAELLRTAAEKLRAGAAEDDRYMGYGGTQFGPATPRLARALADWLEATSLSHDMDREHEDCDRKICASAAAIDVAEQVHEELEI